MRCLHFLICMLSATMSWADDVDPALPALYAVVGVESDDTLNIRAAPAATAAVIGALAPDATGIEVVALSLQGNWGQVNTAETSGWVAMRYLGPQPMQHGPLGLAQGLNCFGTEPFWDIRFADGGHLLLKTPASETSHDILSLAPSGSTLWPPNTARRFRWQDGAEVVTAHILPGQCFDGMSDRTYALHYVDDLGPRIGCCSLTQPGVSHSD